MPAGSLFSPTSLNQIRSTELGLLVVGQADRPRRADCLERCDDSGGRRKSLEPLEELVPRTPRDYDLAARRRHDHAVEAFRHRTASYLGCPRECRAQTFNPVRQRDVASPVRQSYLQALALFTAQLDRTDCAY